MGQYETPYIPAGILERGNGLRPSFGLHSPPIGATWNPSVYLTSRRLSRGHLRPWIASNTPSAEPSSADWREATARCEQRNRARSPSFGPTSATPRCRPAIGMSSRPPLRKDGETHWKRRRGCSHCSVWLKPMRPLSAGRPSIGITCGVPSQPSVAPRRTGIPRLHPMRPGTLSCIAAVPGLHQRAQHFQQSKRAGAHPFLRDGCN